MHYLYMNQSKFLACLFLIDVKLPRCRQHTYHTRAIGGWAEMKYGVFGMCDIGILHPSPFSTPNTRSHPLSNSAPPHETSTCTAFLRDSTPHELYGEVHAASI